MGWPTTIFGVQGAVSALQECARAVLILAYGLAALRLAGRRNFGRWAALDIVVAIVVGSTLSRALTGNAPLAGTLLATTVLLAVHWLLAQAAARSAFLSRLFEGRAVRLASDGKLDRARMKRHGVSDADIAEALHRIGAASVGEARRIVLEPSGSISVLKADSSS